MTKRRLFYIISFVWTLSLILSLAPQIPQFGFKPLQSSDQCEVNQEFNYAIFSASVSFWIPLVIILFVYYRIYREASAQMKFLKTGVKKSNDKSGAEVMLRVHRGPSRTPARSHCCTCDLKRDSCQSENLNMKHNKNSLNCDQAAYTKSVSINQLSVVIDAKNEEKSELISISKENKLDTANDPNDQLLKPSNRDSLKKLAVDFLMREPNKAENANKNNPNVCKSCNLMIEANNNLRTLNLLSLSSSKTNVNGSTNILSISNKAAKFKSEQKAAKTLAIVVGCFILCWMPFFLILPIGAFCKSCNIPKILFQVLFWMGYCNSAMNPLIYAFSSREFRR